MTTETQTDDGAIDFETLLADLLGTAADAIEEAGYDSTDTLSNDLNRQYDRGFSAAMDELRKIPYSERPGNKELVQAVDEAVREAVHGDGSVDDLRRDEDDDDEGAELDAAVEDLLEEMEAGEDEDASDVSVGAGEHYCGALGRVVELEASRCPQCIGAEDGRTGGD